MRTMRQWMGMLALCAVGGAAVACSEDMVEQPSYRPQEAPRLHSPAESIPRVSRRITLPPSGDLADSDGDIARLFHINCAHCHGHSGQGDGPAAAYLVRKPENLHSQKVHRKSDQRLYDIMTDGHDGMPAFRGLLSAEERSRLVRYVHSFEEG